MPAPQQQQQPPAAAMKDHTATAIEEQMQMNMQIIPVEMLDGSVQQVRVVEIFCDPCVCQDCSQLSYLSIASIICMK